MKYWNLLNEQKEMLLFDAERYVESEVCTLGMVVWLEERYSHSTLEKAINLIIESQQGMRLRFSKQGEEYVQYEVPYSYEELPVIDYGTASQDTIRNLLAEKAKKRMPLLECKLYDIHIITSQQYTGVACYIHHGIADGWTGMLFATYVGEYSDKISKGEMPELAVRMFTDSIMKRQEMYQSKRYNRDRQYWQEMFCDWDGVCLLNPDALITDNPKGCRITKKVEQRFANQIIDFCKRENMLPAVLFEAALIVYLHAKNPNKRRVDIGQNLYNRTTMEEKETMGMYAAERMLCVEIGDSDSISAILDKVKDANMSAYYHGLCLHDEVLELAKEQHPSVEAVRDVEFSYLPNADFEKKGISGEWIPNDAVETSLEFTVNNLAGEDAFTFIFDYREEVFTKENAQKVFGDILNIADKIMMNKMNSVGGTIHETL